MDFDGVLPVTLGDFTNVPVVDSDVVAEVVNKEVLAMVFAGALPVMVIDFGVVVSVVVSDVGMFVSDVVEVVVSDVGPDFKMSDGNGEDDNVDDGDGGAVPSCVAL